MAGGRGFCWGSNFFGQFGAGPSFLLGNFSVPVAVAGEHELATVTAGDSHSCARAAAGEVYCWGSHLFGELGIGEDRTPESCHGRPCASSPRVLGALASARAVSAGGAHTCVLDDAGQVLCWGRNDAGQLGTGAAGEPSDVPLAVVGEAGAFVDLAAGRQHTCALGSEGRALCWGRSDWGQAGDASGTSCLVGEMEVPCNPTPVSVADTLLFVGIASGAGHTCGLTGGGEVYCWGLNASGQLGVVPDPTADETCGSGGDPGRCSAAPVRVQGEVAFVALTAGDGHTCGVDGSGGAHCWGSNLVGQLGICRNDPMRAHPAAVCGDHAFVQVSAGSLHSCGITDTGEAYCWGLNDLGVLGSTTPTALGPVEVATPPGFR